MNLLQTEVGSILDGLCAVAEEVKIDFLWRPSLKDPEEEMVLETAVNGGADLLLTFNARDFSNARQFAIEIDQPGLEISVQLYHLVQAADGPCCGNRAVEELHISPQGLGSVG